MSLGGVSEQVWAFYLLGKAEKQYVIINYKNAKGLNSCGDLESLQIVFGSFLLSLGMIKLSFT